MHNHTIDKFFEHIYLPCVIGVIIFLSNLTVVISSGLIIKNGKQPKSTYLLLGNISLADTIIGASIIFGEVISHSAPSEPVCMIQMGILVAPTMVSKFSVGLIAVDRYIFIIHGLYYKRWCNTTRVRICIFITWIVGMIIGFLPLAGWTNRDLAKYDHCEYLTLFPIAIILLNSLLSIVPIVLVVILYTIILKRALKHMKEMNTTVKKFNSNTKEEIELRINRGNPNGHMLTQSNKQPKKQPNIKINRSASFNNGCVDNVIHDKLQTCQQSRSNEDLTNFNKITQLNYKNDNARQHETIKPYKYESEFSIQSISSTISEQKHYEGTISSQKKQKSREPNKWRAITVVMLTSGSFILTWMPFFITAIFFVFCDEDNLNFNCERLHTLLLGPIAALAYINSILNPLIYAWWHKGFKRTIKAHCQRIMQRFFPKNVNR